MHSYCRLCKGNAINTGTIFIGFGDCEGQNSFCVSLLCSFLEYREEIKQINAIQRSETFSSNFQ